VAAAP
jgi:hypothetical protein